MTYRFDWEQLKTETWREYCEKWVEPGLIVKLTRDWIAVASHKYFDTGPSREGARCWPVHIAGPLCVAIEVHRDLPVHDSEKALEAANWHHLLAGPVEPASAKPFPNASGQRFRLLADTRLKVCGFSVTAYTDMGGVEPGAIVYTASPS